MTWLLNNKLCTRINQANIRPSIKTPVTFSHGPDTYNKSKSIERECRYFYVSCLIKFILPKLMDTYRFQRISFVVMFILFRLHLEPYQHRTFVAVGNDFQLYIYCYTLDGVLETPLIAIIVFKILVSKYLMNELKMT